MEKIKITLLLLLATLLPVRAQRVEPVQFGDFEHWTIRHIRESDIIGGTVQTLYVVGPDETIDKNEPYSYKRTIWASSNAYARVMGVTKTSVTVEPEKGPTGLCARLTTRFASCQVVGLMEIKVLATGALYWGRMLEPITGVKDPYSFMDWGIPFTKRPSALILDCKAELPATGMLTKGTTFRQKEFPGEDPCQIMLLLQNRREDEDGNIHALRVGTAVLRIGKSSDWMKNLRVPVIYGDASAKPGYGAGMELLKGERALYAVNSRGKRKPILEEGWAEPGTPCTHAVLQITAGCRGAFTGALGNTLWVDNIRLEYPE
ncbi:MAG: PCMD domain-containing protein [Bacteroidales bacterium]|nr:PCMD domain-containing protein [Bacteroidales bacterium]